MSNDGWFHAMVCGEFVSTGRFGPETPPNYTLFGVFEWLRQLDLTGARAIDVGTMDGLVAFIMKRLGAREVIATDLAHRVTFEKARQALALDIDYRVPLSALELPQALGADKADVIVMAGVLYHVLDPVAVLVACRHAMRRGGFLVLETTYLFDEGHARVAFSPADISPRMFERPNVFWRPSKRALEGMLELVGFEVLGTIAVDARLAVLAQARRPSDISGRSAGVERVHRRYKRYANYREHLNLEHLEREEDEASPVRFLGARGDRRLYPGLHRPAVPFQPAWSPPNPRAHVRRLARSAWFHARSVLAEAVARMTARAE
jgi:SAM-dependent methyltransferase